MIRKVARLKMLLLAIALLGANVCKGVVAFYHFEYGTQVLLLGASHLAQLEEDNTQIMKNILAIIEQYEPQMQGNLYFTFELNEELTERVIADQPYESTIPHHIKMLIQAMKERRGRSAQSNVYLQAFDPRGIESDLRNYLYKGVLRKLRKVQGEAIPVKNLPLLKQLSDSTYPSTVKEEFAHAESYIDQVDRWKGSSDDPVVTEIFTSKRERMVSSLAQIRTAFNAKHNLLVKQALHNVLVQQESIKAMTRTYHEIYQAFINNLDYVYADAGFLSKIMSACARKVPIMLFVGYAHVQALVKDLQQAGFTKLAGNSCYNVVDAEKELFEIAFNAKHFEGLEQALQTILLSASTRGQQQCVICHKGEQEEVKLLTCGRCKARFYCSKACQIKDWHAGHKKTCLPA